MRGVPSRYDGVQLVGGRVGSGGAYRWNRLRPAFMEPLGVPPTNSGYGVGVRGDGALRMMRKRSSSFPIKDDAGYIGYLSDDDESGGSGDEGIMGMVRRQRRELLGIDGDISFSMCCLLVVIVLMMSVAVAVAVWR